MSAQPGGEADEKAGPRWLAHVLAVLCLAAVALILAEDDIAANGIAALSFPFLLAVLVAVGWLLAWKRPGLSLGWLVLGVPALFTLVVPASLLGQALLPDAPGAAAWLFWYSGGDGEDGWSWIPPVWLLLTQIPLRFPDGRLPSPRWRWFSRFTVVALISASLLASTWSVEVAPGIPNPGQVGWNEEQKNVSSLVVFGVLLLPSFVGSIASLFVRYRRAESVARAQLRWVFLAVFVSVGLLLLTWLIPAGSYDVVQGFVLVGYALIPVAIAVAVLRYHLYDIDRIISRTASYAIVTLVLVGSYAVVVVSIGAVLPGLPSVAVALATLAAAALFLPVLRVVQRVVDRRFDRARYNGQKVVDAFGERLRNGADPHTAAAELGVAVEATLQPSAMGLWVRAAPSAAGLGR